MHFNVIAVAEKIGILSSRRKSERHTRRYRGVNTSKCKTRISCFHPTFSILDEIIARLCTERSLRRFDFWNSALKYNEIIVLFKDWIYLHFTIKAEFSPDLHHAFLGNPAIGNSFLCACCCCCYFLNRELQICRGGQCESGVNSAQTKQKLVTSLLFFL